MTLTATYVDATAKVTLAATGIPALADTVLIQRSVDQVNWTTVRGAAALIPSASSVTIDDYEYTDGVTNYYQASYVDNAVIAFQGNAALISATAAGASVTVSTTVWPTTQLGSTVLFWASCTNNAATLACSTPGWTSVVTVGANALFMARWTSGLALPAVVASGTVAGNILTGKLVSYWNAAVPATTTTTQVNASAQNINYPSITAPPNSDGVLYLFKPSINTALSPGASTDDTATGYTVAIYNDLNGSLASGTITVTGGAAAASYAIAAFMTQAAYMSQDSATVIPAMTKSWLKNPLRPYLNVPIGTIIGFSDVTRAQRTGVFDVIARTLPVVVTDLQGPRQTTLSILTAALADLQNLEGFFSPGEVLFVQPTAAYASGLQPTMYAVVDQGVGPLTRKRLARTSTYRQVDIPLIEVAAPDPTLAATLSTYQTVINLYATYAAVGSAFATYGALLQLVGSAADVITT